MGHEGKESKDHVREGWKEGLRGGEERRMINVKKIEGRKVLSKEKERVREDETKKRKRRERK